MNITEKYFRAIGWKPKPFSSVCPDAWGPKETSAADACSLPNITQSFPDFKKWVLEKMEGEKMHLLLCLPGSVVWGRDSIKDYTQEAEYIVDNEILEAAVVAATTYFEGKK